MILRKRIYEMGERFADSVLERAATFAFPGRDVPLPPVLVIALPKSGSVYLQRALRRTLRVQVHHITSSGMSGATFREADLCRFAQGNVVSREHLQPRPFALNVLARYGINKAVLHVRDPRAAIVSWTRHMDRVLASRGFRSVELSCEMPLPDAYPSWSFEDRLHWQVENKMPSFVHWIEDWLALAETNRDVELLVTDHAALLEDGRDLITRILDFYEIPYDPEWLSMPSTAYGKNNIYSFLEAERTARARPAAERGARFMPSWAMLMPGEIRKVANTLMPDPLSRRFGWDGL